jgi:hypothetical protein
MPIRNAKVTITGVVPLLTNNPQMVDRFNSYSKKIKQITNKGTKRTDDDYMEHRQLELEAKVFFDPTVGIYVPASWLTEAIATNGFAVAKIAKAKTRGALFGTTDKIALDFKNKNLVKTTKDIVNNPAFHHLMGIPQGQVRVMKIWPIFHGWSFSTTLEYDDKVMDPSSLSRIVQHAAQYGGFGDFRPRFGRATAEVVHV